MCAVQSDYLLFVRVSHHYFVCLIAIPKFHGSAQIRHRATTRNSGTVSFPVKITKIYVKIQKMQQSHSLAPHEETACS